MFERSKTYSATVWKWFRNRSRFTQILLVVPLVCGITLFLLVGNMGLALMGTAFPIYSFVVGFIGSAIGLILGKAGIIVAKDRHKAR